MNRDRYFRLRASVSLGVDNCKKGLSYIYLGRPNTPCLEKLEDLLSIAKNVLSDAHQLLIENKERMITTVKVNPASNDSFL